MAKTATAPPLTASSAPQVDLLAQCATSPNGPFGFWLNVEPMNTVGTTSVRVQLLLDGVPFRTVTASQGLGITFPIGHAGVVSAVVGGVVVAEARSSTVPCGTGSAGVTLTGMCRDPAAGHEWLIGNFRAGTVDFDIRLNGAVIQTLTVASAGFVGFTTQAGGFAQAFAGGTEVASADSSEVPCVPTQATIAGRCFSPQPGYLWSVVNNTAAPITVDLVVAGTVPVVLALAPHELRYVFTHDGGDARLVRNGTVIAVAASEPFPCGGPPSP